MKIKCLDLTKDSINEFVSFISHYGDYHGEPPSVKETIEYLNTIYHWQVMNTLLHKFGLQKYKGEYIFNYSSWNYDKPLTYVFLESDFRRYLRLAWSNQLDQDHRTNW